MSSVKKPSSLETILKIVTGAAGKKESPSARSRRHLPANYLTGDRLGGAGNRHGCGVSRSIEPAVRSDAFR
jgi:hypothetical protein